MPRKLLHADVSISTQWATRLQELPRCSPVASTTSRRPPWQDLRRCCGYYLNQQQLRAKKSSMVGCRSGFRQQLCSYPVSWLLLVNPCKPDSRRGQSFFPSQSHPCRCFALFCFAFLRVIQLLPPAKSPGSKIHISPEMYSYPTFTFVSI